MHLAHSAPVVTHRSASGAQPAGQQVCASAGVISAYAKTRITSLRYPMPFPSLTPIGGGKLVLAPSRPDPAAEIVEHKINVLIIARRHDRGGPIGPTHYATPSTNGIQADGGRVVPAQHPPHKNNGGPRFPRPRISPGPQSAPPTSSSRNL